MYNGTMTLVCTTKVTFLPLPIAQAGLQSNNFKYPTTQILPSASHCAKACYSQKCTSAAYQPLNSTSGSCLLTYQNLPECPSDDGGSAEKSIQRTDAYNGSEPIVLQCLKCEASAATAEQRPFCSQALTYTAFPLSNPENYAKLPDTLPVKNYDACLKFCYQRGCSKAYYLQVNNSYVSFVCTLSFDKETGCSVDDGKNKLTDLSNFQGSIEFRCVKCGGESGYGNVVKAETTQLASTVQVTTVSPLSSTSVASVPEPQPEPLAKTSCQNLRFLVLLPNPDREVPFDQHRTEFVDDLPRCAQRCYQSGCLVAGYLPSTRRCLMAFPPSASKYEKFCGGAAADGLVDNFNATTPVQLQCFSCENSLAISNKPEITFNIEATTGYLTLPPKDITPERTYVAPSTSANATTERSMEDCTVIFQTNEQLTQLRVEYQDHRPVLSVSHCATVCYLNGCTLAHYTPAGSGSDAGNSAYPGIAAGGQSSTCRLFYEPVESAWACSRSKLDHHVYHDDRTVQIQCVRCKPVRSGGGGVVKPGVATAPQSYPATSAQDNSQGSGEDILCKPATTAAIGAYPAVNATTQGDIGVVSHYVYFPITSTNAKKHNSTTKWACLDRGVVPKYGFLGFKKRLGVFPEIVKDRTTTPMEPEIR
uniref:PAN domain protein n=1 Tax=Romanomermis culicivorax TaxID=13658 RepID=A0A915HXW9_ROMCU